MLPSLHSLESYPVFFTSLKLPSASLALQGRAPPQALPKPEASTPVFTCMDSEINSLQTS